MDTGMPASLRAHAQYQAGVITRRQALRSGLSRSAIVSKLKQGWWRKVYAGVYVTFTGPIAREAQLWAVVLYAGPGARLSYETAAELIRLTDRRSPLIHVTIPASRQVIPPPGVVIHRSTIPRGNWRFARGVPPHTFAEETVIDLVQAATDLDDVIAYVTSAFGKKLTSEGRLRSEVACHRHRSRHAPLRVGRRHPPRLRDRAAGSRGAAQARLDRHAQALLAGLPRDASRPALVRCGAGSAFLGRIGGRCRRGRPLARQQRLRHPGRVRAASAFTAAR